MVEKWVTLIVEGGVAALPIVRRCPVEYPHRSPQQTKLAPPFTLQSLTFTPLPLNITYAVRLYPFVWHSCSHSPCMATVHGYVYCFLSPSSFIHDYCDECADPRSALVCDKKHYLSKILHYHKATSTPLSRSHQRLKRSFFAPFQMLPF